jgi:hypothetical protein
MSSEAPLHSTTPQLSSALLQLAGQRSYIVPACPRYMRADNVVVVPRFSEDAAVPIRPMG